MNDDFFIQQVRDAKEVVVTPHALERGYDEEDIRELVRGLDGVLYFDTEEKMYHLATGELVVLLRVQDGKRIVVTAYPNDEPERYHSIRYRLLQG